MKLFNDDSNDKIKEKVEALKSEIERHNKAYYVDDKPLISDVEYDKLLKELQDLENRYPEYRDLNSPTLQVGSNNFKDTKFKKVKHRKPMLSLSNSYNIGDIIAFSERVEKILNDEKSDLEYVLELKLDGASISLIYEDGELVRAVTRGDGIEGEDVTDNVIEIESIPKKLKESVDLEIRGEIVLPISKFNEINEQRLKENKEIFANPRNAASGTLRQLDSSIVKERGLDGYFYFLVDAERLGIKTQSESIKYIERLGIKTTGVAEIIRNTDELEEKISYWEKAKENLDYETDGLVMKLNNMSLWEKVGYTTKSPRWAIAYKFPAKQVSTKLIDITWQVGRTGKITPVAELEEVELSGSRVKRASLHNIDEIYRKDIKIGDRVFIEKAAEIIPQVVSSIKELRTGAEREIELPKSCPVCKKELAKDEGMVDYKCINEKCPAKIQASIQYFVSRDGMNISGFGSRLVEKLLELGFIKNVVDIFYLYKFRDKMINLEKLGEKSVDNLLKNIEESKKREYPKTLYALGIPYVGKFLATLLAKESKNIDILANMTHDELLTIDGVGEKVADAVYNFFRDEQSRDIVEKLKEVGVNFLLDETSTPPKVESEFTGKNFLFTGKLKNFKRDEIKKIIENMGGVNLNSVSKKLDYLIVGEDAGSKLKKALELGTIKILTEDEFIEKIKV